MKKNTLTLGLSLLLSLLMVGCDKPTPSTGNSEQSSEPQISESVGGQESSDKQESTGTSESTGGQESTGGEQQEATLKLNASDLEVGTIHDPVGHNGFTLRGGEDSKGAAKDLTVEALETEITLGESTYTQCVKTGGGSSTTAGSEYRIVSFDVEGSGTLTVVAKAASSDKVCSVGLLNVTKGVEHDNAELTSEVAAYTLEFHSSGTYYVTFANSVRFYELSVEVTGESDDNWEPEIVVENPNEMIASNLNGGDYDSFTYGNFTFTITEEGKKFTVDTNSKTLNGVKYTSRFKTGGNGTVTFNVEAKGTITIVCMSSSSTADRTAMLTNDATGELVGEAFTVKGDALYEFNFEVEAGSYTFATETGGINIYALYIDLA